MRAECIGLSLAAMLAAGVAACDRAPRRLVECLVVTADSTFWLTSGRNVAQARGAPMLLARVDGRFKELYVVDDDQSFYDAVFVGYRLYARDLVRGDSVELRRDSAVAALAASYAATHPDERRLGPDDAENDDAAIRATSDLEILGVHGPYVSYEHHTDVDARDETLARHVHEYRRGVLDARGGGRETVASLFGAAAAETLAPAARREWQTIRDTVFAMAARPGSGRARRTIAAYSFDPSSFTIGSSGATPLVVFAVPASGTDPDLDPVELPGRPVAAPAWWPLAAAELSVLPGEGGTWVRDRDTLRVRVERGSRTWTIALRHGDGVETTVARVSSAVERVIWLEPDLAREVRGALARAFAEAGDHEGDRQIATLDPADPPLHLASHDNHERPASPRLHSRDIRPDDAAGREHGRSRLRRRDPGDAGQDSRGLRDAARPQAVRNGIG